LPSRPVPGSTEPGKFGRLFAEARPALLAGTHQLQFAPADNGPRWGISAVLRPDPRAARAIEQIAVTAAGVVGDGHWIAGAAASSHLTLRGGLERYRTSVPVGDPLVARYAAALRTAAGGIGPIRFAVTGLTLTPTSVMACAIPADAAADDLAAAFGAALTADGLQQAGSTPDIWYLNLVYFTGPVRDAADLIDWVAARRAAAVTDVLVTDIQITRWRYTGAGMRPVVLASVTPPPA
jgi:hypothetical protein